MNPFAAISAIPAATSTIRDMTNVRFEVPEFIPDKCTGCSQCWVQCPDAAIPGVVNDIPEVLEAAVRSVENGKRGFVMTLEDGQVGFGSTEFIVLREKTLGPEHIYFLTCSADFRKHAELSMTGASGRQRVQEECFSFFLVKTPPPEIREQFREIVRPHFLQIHLLSRQIDCLTRARDLLLPWLISGRLSVENLDIQLPPAMSAEFNAKPAIAAHA